jgi:hypothetical protein
MCTNEDAIRSQTKGFTLSYFEKKLRRFAGGSNEFKENYKDTFVFTGGETTLSANLFPVSQLIRRFFPEARILCLSNGRRFAYLPYAKKTLENIDDIAIALHGHTPKLHDKITRTQGSFSQTVKGISHILALKRPSQELELRIILHRINYRSIDKITRFIRREFPAIDRLVYLFFLLEGQAIHNLPVLKISYRDIAPYIAETQKAIPLFRQVRYYHFPLCTLPPGILPFVWKTLPAFELAYPDQCDNCRAKIYCAGVFKGYIKYMGASEFQPITKKLDIVAGPSLHRPVGGIKLNA